VALGKSLAAETLGLEERRLKPAAG